jgi:hypothetical protein
MAEIEAALAALDAKVAEAQKSSDQLSKALKKLRQAAATGHIGDIEKGLSTIAEHGREAEAAARSLAGAWAFDARAYLAAGYAEELRAEVAGQGVNVFEKDGRLYAFPLIMRIDPRDALVRLGKKPARTIRPKHLAKLLAAAQKRPQRFPEARFLALLYEVYRSIAGAEWRNADRGPAISLAQIHDLLTLLPGADYPPEEFARDLLLLDRQPDLRTKDGAAFEFAGATLSKGSMKRIVVYDEQGNERTYIAVRFLKGR